MLPPSISFGHSALRCALLVFCMALSTSAMAQNSIWPVTGANNHQMLTGYGDGAPDNVFGFHEGIDIWVDGKGGQDVVNMRKGKVIWKNPDYQGGSITIEVAVSDTLTEWDRYLHVGSLEAGFAIGDTIDPGIKLGVISTSKYTEGNRHLHISVLSAKPPDDSAPAQTSELNPFLRFAADADRDPMGKTPKLADVNNDGKKFLITRSGTPDEIEKQTINGNVDFIADAVDQMNSTLPFPSAPFAMGYYVEPRYVKNVTAHGVKNDNQPYLLYKYDDNWFAGSPYANDADKGKLYQVYDQTRKVDPNTTAFPALQSAILTNTKGTTGRVDKVDKNQYWKTDAKDDGADDTVEYANYADKPATLRNAQARFRDGEYDIHVITKDAGGHGNDEIPGKVRLNNFTQTAAPGSGGRAPDPTTNFPVLYTPDNHPYVPEFLPEGQTADILATFNLNENVGITGDQYYPNLSMPAYIFPHRDQWNEGDEYQGWTKRIAVLSDDDGQVPLTSAWNADKLGLFDILIDYNRDGVFSWTLDGLGGFQVIPEPASFMLLLIASISLRTRRR